MSSCNAKPSRRVFIRRSLAAISAASLLRVVGQPDQAWAQDLPAIDAASPLAQSFGYYEDASKVDTSKYPKRAGAEGAKQFCSNCQLLTQAGLPAPAGKAGEWGKCALFPTGLVAVNGWCNQWILKQG